MAAWRNARMVMARGIPVASARGFGARVPGLPPRGFLFVGKKPPAEAGGTCPTKKPLAGAGGIARQKISPAQRRSLNSRNGSTVSPSIWIGFLPRYTPYAAVTASCPSSVCSGPLHSGRHWEAAFASIASTR